jgi:hypothetical protein
MATAIAANSMKELVALTGKLPAYTVAASSFQRKGGGKPYGLSPDDRILFIKKQLCADLASSGFTTENTLPLLISQMVAEHTMEESMIQIYFDTLTSCAR